MDNAFNSPVQVLDANMTAGEGKAKIPLLKCILLGIMAGSLNALCTSIVRSPLTKNCNSGHS